MVIAFLPVVTANEYNKQESKVHPLSADDLKAGQLYIFCVLISKVC